MDKESAETAPAAAPAEADVAAETASPSAVGGAAGFGLGPLGRMPVATRAATLVRVQQGAGNGVLARRIAPPTARVARDGNDSSGGTGTPVPSSTAPSDESSAGGPARVGKPDFEQLIKEKSTRGIRQVESFAEASSKQRTDMIEILLTDTWWVGGSDRQAITKIWEAFGTAGIAEAFAANEPLWDRCAAKEIDMGGLQALKPYREKFGSDVKAVALHYQRVNLEAVNKERARLNVGQVDDVFKAGGEPPVPGKEIIEIQQLAKQVQRADDALAGLMDIPVAVLEVDAPPATATADRGSAGGSGTPAPGGNAEGPAPAPLPPAKVKVDVKFHPEQRPPKGAEGPAPGREKEFRTYEDVLAQHKRLTAARAVIASKSPALFAISQGNKTEAGKLAEMSPREAWTTLGRMLNTVEESIKKAGPMIAEDKLDWRDLSPIHDQLHKGKPAASKLDWSSKLAKTVAKSTIADYKETEFWRTLGLAGISGAAFLFSEIATGGMATFLWAAGAGASAVQGARSYASYEELKTATQTATSQETRLVGSEQVSEAQAAAVLDAVFAFVDIAMAAKGIAGGAKAAQAAGRVGAREALQGLVKGGGEKAAEVLRKAISELGAQETLRMTGMSADEVVKLVGGEASLEGKAVRAAEKDASVVRPRGSLGGLPEPAASALGRMRAAEAHAVFERWGTFATAEDRIKALVDVCNKEMDRIGAPRLGAIAGDNLKGGGELAYDTWSVAMRKEYFTAATIEVADFNKLWGLVAHEAEHGKQWFEILQWAHAEGKDVSEVLAKMGVPLRVGEAASAVQEGTRKGIRLVKGSEEYLAASRFFESVTGRLELQRSLIYTKMDSAARANKKAEEAFRALPKVLAPEGAEVTGKLEAWEKAWAEFKEAESSYMKLPEEVAAYKAQGAHVKAIEEHQELLARLREASASEGGAIDEIKRLRTDVSAAEKAGKPTEEVYDLRLRLSTAEERANVAADAVVSAVEGLERVAQGMKP